MPRIPQTIAGQTFAGCLVAITVGGVLLVGCQLKEPGVDPQFVEAMQEKLVLPEEPTGAVTPLDLREAEGGFAAGPVVLVGQIGGMPNPWAETEKNFPWVDGEATFFLVDPATAAEFAEHADEDPEHHENCPFCARAAAKSVDSIAAITFNDANGQPIDVTANELFDLEPNDVVVVRGEGRLLSGDLLVIQADGIYVRE